MIALLLAEQIGVLFLMMAGGFVLVKTGLVKSEESRTLSMVSIYLILPCVTIHAFQVEYSDEIRNGFLLGIFAAVAIHLILFLLSWIFGRLLHLEAVEKASLIYSNAGNLILPLVTAVLGPEWEIYATSFLCVQMILIWTHGQSLMRGQAGINWKKILLNLNLIAIAVGLILFFARIRLPELLGDAVGSMASTIGPVSMVMIGMLLGSVKWKSVFSGQRIYLIVALKMLVFSRGGARVPEAAGVCRAGCGRTDDPADQSAGGDHAVGLDDHADGAALQPQCCLCQRNQRIYHGGVHRYHAPHGAPVHPVSLNSLGDLGTAKAFRRIIRRIVRLHCLLTAGACRLSLSQERSGYHAAAYHCSGIQAGMGAGVCKRGTKDSGNPWRQLRRDLPYREHVRTLDRVLADHRHHAGGKKSLSGGRQGRGI